MLVSHEISQNWLLMHTACHLRHLWYREKLKSNHLTTIGGVVESHEEDESMNHLLSINAIQDALDVSRSTVYRLAKSLEKSLHQTNTLWAFMRSGVNHSYSFTGHPVAQRAASARTSKVSSLTSVGRSASLIRRQSALIPPD